MQENPLISVIVPIYNVAPWLPRCLDSIVGQTYKNLEILLIDDGSTDNSLEICQQYAEKDPRIKVIHQENKGVSAARNAGLDVATGEFISFVDPDDWLEKNCYQQVMSLKTQANMIIFSFYRAFDTQLEKYIFPLQIKQSFYPPDGLLLYILEQGAFSSCNKLYQRAWIGEIRFDSFYTIAEDFHFLVQLTRKGGNITQVDIPLYFYYQRSMSAVRNINSNGWYRVFLLMQKLNNEFKETNLLLLQKALLDRLLTFSSAFSMAALLNNEGHSEHVLQAKQILCKYRNQILKVKTMHLGGKSFALIFSFFPQATAWLCRLPGINYWLKKSFAQHMAK
ncbi:MAG: glycosyltransferase [Elusimicrobiaceae bacterium]|nr:glycosyltransferase [Elusimicrobiaceae bacterium]